jgi:hypothetical protein
MPADGIGDGHPALALLRDRDVFWHDVVRGRRTGRLILRLAAFIVAAGALYGVVLAGWRSPRLALYVAVKLPLLMLGTTGLVMILNWFVALLLGSGMRLRQVVAVTFGAMAAACWILLSLVPVTLFFTFGVAEAQASPRELQLTHNCLLLTHILFIACAGLAGNAALYHGLRRVVRPTCPARGLHAAWVMSFAFVGCQMSWILRPFVGSPFFPVCFLRPDALERNFYEFVLFEVIPFVIKGG